MSDVKAAMVAEEVQGVVSTQGAWNRVERLEEELAAALRRAEEAEARGFRAGLLRAAEECEGYAAVVADEYDDGPHSVHADVARHLAKELRTIADRCVRGVRLL